MDQLLWQEGCYCYRDSELEEARQLGLAVRCGGGLPCSCALFDENSLAVDDPLFNETPAGDWPSGPSDDALKQDVWPSQVEQPDQQAEVQTQEQSQNSRNQRGLAKRGAPDAGACCPCPCRKLHEAAAKKRRCCGDNCQCSAGACACPDHLVSTSGRCCEGVGAELHLTKSARESAREPAHRSVSTSTDSVSVPSAMKKLSVLSVIPRSNPTSEESSKPNSVGLRTRQALSTPVRHPRIDSPVHNTPVPPNGVVKAPDGPGRTSCRAPLSPNSHPSAQPQAGTVPGKTDKLVKLEETHVDKYDQEFLPSVFNCTDCVQSFATQHELESHGAKKHRKDRPFVCSTCSASFLFKQNRDRHVVEVHQGKRPHQCPHAQCGSAFKNSSGLKQHMRTVHDKERPFKCEQCDSSFGQRNHLTQHVRVVHHRLKLFNCTVCDTSFSNRGNLNQHVRRKHGDSARTSSAACSRLSPGAH